MGGDDLVPDTVDERDHASEDRAGGRSARKGISLSTDDDLVVVAQGGNIRVTTSLGVELAGGRQVGGVGQVVGNGIILVAGPGEVDGEAASGGDDTSIGRCAGNFGLVALRALSSADRSDVGAGSGEGRIEAAVRGVIAGLKVGNTIITRRNQDGNTLQAKLAGFSVEALDVLQGILRSNGTVGDGVNQRGVRSASQSDNPVQEGICRVATWNIRRLI